MPVSHEVKEALERSADLIERLNREREILAVKAQAFDLIMSMRPRYDVAWSPDAVTILRDLLSKIEREEKAQDVE